MAATVRRPWVQIAGLLIGAALVAVLATPVSAGPLPPPSADYETEALELCSDGDLQCVGETLDAMRQHTRELAQSCDHNAIFAALYTVVTTYYYDTVAADPDFFGDTAFVNHEDVAFAYYYFWPYVNWNDGPHDAVPRAWQVAFEAADAQQVSPTGNLLLGINAHVVRDLPFVLARLGMGHKADHDRVNDILWAAYEPAIRAIDEHLADSIDDGDIDGTSLDQQALFEVVASWREQAWQDAKMLANARTDLDRAAVAAAIEEKAYLQAEEFRTLYAYVPGSEALETRNEYCGEQSWPPDWLGG